MSSPGSGSESRFPLGALAPLYAGAVALRSWLYDAGWLRARRLCVPVISVGNLTVGGSGKSPMTALVARRLAERGHRPAIVSRGYRGSYAERAVVVSRGEGPIVGAAVCGDEPVMLARLLPGVPVVVSRRRADGGDLAARQLGARCVVLDDGFQHRGLRRDLDLLLIDGADPFGNGRLLPAGPLREPLSAMGRAHAIVVTRSAAADWRAIEAALAVHCPRAPVFRARSRPVGVLEERSGDLAPIEALRGRKVVCFAGIAHPRRFFDDASAAGALVAATLPFADHHRYRAADLDRVAAAAIGCDADLVLTTEKDLARLDRAERPAALPPLHALRAETIVDDEAALVSLVEGAFP